MALHRNNNNSKTRRNQHEILKEIKPSFTVHGSKPKKIVTETKGKCKVVFKTEVTQERMNSNLKGKRKFNICFSKETTEDLSAGPTKPKVHVTEAKVGSKLTINAEEKF